jgi:hypothetical protein
MMAAPSFLNQTFDESEEENNDFNSQPGADSDDEKATRFNADEAPPKHSRSSSAPRAQSKESFEDEGRVNGRDASRDRRAKPVEDEADEDADGATDGDNNNNNNNNGEDDEGGGEDLNGDRDDDEDEEDEDEDDEDDEEAVSVGLLEIRQN